jgi:hypothetical protein
MIAHICYDYATDLWLARSDICYDYATDLWLARSDICVQDRCSMYEGEGKTIEAALQALKDNLEQVGYDVTRR